MVSPHSRKRGFVLICRLDKLEKISKANGSKPSKKASLPPGSATTLGFTTSRKLSEEPDSKLSSRVKSELVQIVAEKDLASKDTPFENDEIVSLQTKRVNAKIKKGSLNENSHPSMATAKKQKKHPYGLTPGYSPFPDHVSPTPEDCSRVNELLSSVHGAVSQPTVIPPPSSTVTGCGEVPDLLDALLRTLLSANTSNANSAKALKGLINAFGSIGGSPNWENVRQADTEHVEHAIAAGGQQRIKSKYIKGILDLVYNQNHEVFETLQKSKRTGTQSTTTHDNTIEAEEEVLKSEFNFLSLARIFEIKDTNEAMDELLKFPGIGVKTASCVIMFCMQRPSFAVDTHVQRMCQWLGWAPAGCSESNTFSHLEVRVPNELKYALHHLFIKHGQRCFRCRANTNSATDGWYDCACPLESLVTRTGKLKEPRASPVKKSRPAHKKVQSGRVDKPAPKRAKAKQRKKAGTESNESEAALDLESVASDELSDVEMSDGE